MSDFFSKETVKAGDQAELLAQITIETPRYSKTAQSPTSLQIACN